MTNTFYNLYYYETNRDKVRKKRELYYKEKGELIGEQRRKQYLQETQNPQQTMLAQNKRRSNNRKTKTGLIDIKSTPVNKDGYIILYFP